MNLMVLPPVLFALFVTIGCGDTPTPPCSYDLQEGQRLGLAVIEPYDMGSRFRFDEKRVVFRAPQGCHRFDGLAPGVMMEIQITGEAEGYHSDCRPAMGFVSRPPAQIMLSGTLPRSFAHAGSMTGIGHRVRIGDCVGTWFINLKGRGRTGHLVEPVPGQDPPVVMHREFAPEGGMCRWCDDTFVVRLELL